MLTVQELIEFFNLAGKVKGTSSEEVYQDFVVNGGWQGIIKNHPGFYSEDIHSAVEEAILGPGLSMGRDRNTIGSTFVEGLIQLADTLDEKGLAEEAETVDKLLQQSWYPNAWNATNRNPLLDRKIELTDEEKKKEEKKKEKPEVDWLTPVK